MIVTTKDDYVYRIEWDGTINYLGKSDELDEKFADIELQEGDIQIRALNGPEPGKTYTNQSITLEIIVNGEKPELKDLYVEYSFDNVKWTTYNPAKKITVDKCCSVYGRLTNGRDDSNTLATHNVDIIDKNPPTPFEIELDSSTSTSISIKWINKGDAVATEEQKQSGLKCYQISRDSGVTWIDEIEPSSNSYTFQHLTQTDNLSIKVKAIDNAGNIQESTNTLTVGAEPIEGLMSGDIYFVYTEAGTNKILNTSGEYSRGPVIVTARLKEGFETNYTLKLTTDSPVGASPETAIGWANATEGVTLTENGTVYAVLVDEIGQMGSPAAGNVQVIDISPCSVKVKGTTTNSITFEASDTQSGIKGYMAKTDNTKPDANAGGWTELTPVNNKYEKSVTKTIDKLSQDTTYYVFVKDAVGNVNIADDNSTGTTGKVPGLAQGDIGWDYSPITYANKIKVTASMSTVPTGYTLRVTDTYPADVSVSKEVRLTWNNGNTGIEVTEYKAIYACLIDSDGQLGDSFSTAYPDMLDTKEPTVQITSSTTNSVTFSTTDPENGEEAVSGVVKYMIKENNTKPSVEDSGWKLFDSVNTPTSTTIDKLTQGKTYYVFVMDNATNISSATLVNTGRISNLVSGDIEFSYNPSNWTKGNIVVTASLKSGSASKGTGYTLKVTTDSNPQNANKTTALGWDNASAGIEVNTNNTVVYAILIDNEGQVGETQATANVDKIDRQAPSIDNDTISANSNSVTFTATDSASGLKAYAISTDSNITDASASWNTITGYTENGSSITSKEIPIDNLNKSTTYYLLLKDRANNVCDAINIETTNMEQSAGNIDSSITWSTTEAKATSVTFTAKSGYTNYYIQTKVGNGTWSATPSNTGTASVSNVASGTTVYARLVDSDGQYNSDTDYVEQPVVLKYNIAYDANGGISTMTGHTDCVYGDSITLKANEFTRTGYSFLGWATSPSATTATYTAGQIYSNLTNINGRTVTLFAVWDGLPYTVSLSSGNYISSVSGSGTYKCGSQVTISATPQSQSNSYNYYFSSWSGDYTVDNSSSVTFTMPAQDVTLTANGTRSSRTYYVYYYSNGGSGSMTNSSGTYNSSVTLKSCTFTAPTGKEFNYWALGSASGSSVTSVTLNGSKSVYAVWKDKTYYVTYNANGGSGTMTNSSGTYNSSVTLKSCTFTPPSGKTFDHWALGSASGSTVTSVTLNGNKSVYAVWRDATYTVSYNSNGGSGSMSSSTGTVGSSVTLKSNGFTAPSGYSFDGWATSSTGHSAVSSVSSACTVYAIWKCNGGTTETCENWPTGHGADRLHR